MGLDWKDVLYDRLAAVVDTLDHLSGQQKRLVLNEEFKAAVESTEANMAFGAPIPDDRGAVPVFDDMTAARIRLAELRLRNRVTIVPSSQESGGKRASKYGIVSVGGKDPITTWIRLRFRTLLSLWRAPKRN